MVAEQEALIKNDNIPDNGRQQWLERGVLDERLHRSKMTTAKETKLALNRRQPLTSKAEDDVKRESVGR